MEAACFFEVLLKSIRLSGYQATSHKIKLFTGATDTTIGGFFGYLMDFKRE
jgi:hypothetical protein